MNPTRMLIFLTVVGTTGSILFAAEPARTPAPTPAPPATEAAAPDAESASKDAAPSEPTKDEDADPAPPAKSGADQAPSPQRFVPSEQVRADFDVSFPIDI